MSSIPQRKRGYVYLIRMESTNYFKVGISSTAISERMAGLQTGNPCKLILLSSYRQADPVGVEYHIHRALRPYRIRNEWFECDEAFITGLFDQHNAMAHIDARLRGKPIRIVTVTPRSLPKQRIAAPKREYTIDALQELANLVNRGVITNVAQGIKDMFDVTRSGRKDSRYAQIRADLLPLLKKDEAATPIAGRPTAAQLASDREAA